MLAILITVPISDTGGSNVCTWICMVRLGRNDRVEVQRA